MARRGQRRSKLVRQLTVEAPEVILSPKELAVCVAKWQRILRLQDWDIRLRMARHSEMHLTNAAGEISIFDAKKIATVHVLHPEDFTLMGVTAPVQDMEYTIVHELLHIHLHPMRAREVDEEQAIHAMATALVQCYRGQWSQ